jgi:AcrR family transcriptional regulator
MTRPQDILDTAAKLFAERGFHGVSVHEIGAACGISGPALYKHFSSKDEILGLALTQISERLVQKARRRVAHTASAQTALDALVDCHVNFALASPELIVIQQRERANLKPEARSRVRVLQLHTLIYGCRRCDDSVTMSHRPRDGQQPRRHLDC